MQADWNQRLRQLPQVPLEQRCARQTSSSARQRRRGASAQTDKRRRAETRTPRPRLRKTQRVEPPALLRDERAAVRDCVRTAIEGVLHDLQLVLVAAHTEEALRL
jgi:hypothetical protein